jgi:multidrug efflux system membrane fusion protein
MAAKRFRWGFVAAGGLAAVLVIWATAGHPKSSKTDKSNKPSIVPVAVATVTAQDLPLSIKAIGAAQAWQTVLIRPQVSGKLQSLAYREGSFVKKGQLLAVIDPAPFNAALMQAQGALARDTAILQNARNDLNRYQTLLAQDSIARQTYDTQAAAVKQDEGVVMIDQGQVDAAKINVGYTRISAPVSGRVGVKLVDVGNLVSSTDTTGIVSIAEVSPIAVVFTVPEGDFQRLSAASGAFSRPLAAEAYSQDNGALLGRGLLTIADNHVDSATGTVQLKAKFENPDQKLWPGQFVNVKLTLATMHDAVTIPVTAVNRGPDGPFAYVVGAEKKAILRPVQIDLTQDQTAVIKSGVGPGERVVTDGQLLLKPGSKVSIRDPNAQFAPAPRKGGKGRKAAS